MMTSHSHRYIALNLLVAIAGTRADGQGGATKGTIDGLVTDTTLAPIHEAVVSIDGVNISLLTGSNDSRLAPRLLRAPRS
jgi:hypothetical protein